MTGVLALMCYAILDIDFKYVVMMKTFLYSIMNIERVLYIIFFAFFLYFYVLHCTWITGWRPLNNWVRRLSWPGWLSSASEMTCVVSGGALNSAH